MAKGGLDIQGSIQNKVDTLSNLTMDSISNEVLMLDNVFPWPSSVAMEGQFEKVDEPYLAIVSFLHKASQPTS